MESIEHENLVRLLDNIVREYFDTERLFKFIDIRSNLGKKHPPSIEGFIPDLVYQDLVGNFMIIGEAKTEKDIKTSHTRKQVTAYLSQIFYQNEGVLFISVPVGCEANMKSILHFLCSENNFDQVHYKVVSQISKRIE
ncbi:MAG: hypothetical protein O7D86_06835 [Proteobacteria bacterium]|nr:hypothetical protein [Pseudomonadota bacterium]